MTYYKMAHAKTHLAALIRDALAGREVVIARDDEPLVRLVPLAAPQDSDDRQAGDLVGRVRLPDALFAPLDDEEQSAWDTA
jgi:antitoxin (DNA-binding transcriptional repressor) of toxin-antitoxin stability system